MTTQLSYTRRRWSGAEVVNGSYKLELETQTVLENVLLIPGLKNPLTELKDLLFKQGQAGGIWVPSLSPAMISSESFGTGVETFLDLSGNGKNATQASSGSRPAWGRVPKTGRRNLLNATATLSTQSLTVAAVQHTLSFKGTGTVTLSGASTDGPLVGTGADNIVSLTFTPSAASLTLTVSGTVSEAQLNLGASRGVYQNVISAFNITETGQRDCYYLQPDGVDDGMATASIDFSGTDKVTVFAAVRTLASASSAALVELSSNPFSTDGTFGVLAPPTSNSYRMRSRGTALSDASSATVFAAPDTAILTGQSDISSDINTLRRNGTEIATSPSDQGSGNYISEIVYLFRRGGSVVPYNGQCFGLIVAGSSYSLSTIQRVERILSRYTPGVSL